MADGQVCRPRRFLFSGASSVCTTSNRRKQQDGPCQAEAFRKRIARQEGRQRRTHGESGAVPTENAALDHRAKSSHSMTRTGKLTEVEQLRDSDVKQRGE